MASPRSPDASRKKVTAFDLPDAPHTDDEDAGALTDDDRPDRGGSPEHDDDGGSPTSRSTGATEQLRAVALFDTDDAKGGGIGVGGGGGGGGSGGRDGAAHDESRHGGAGVAGFGADAEGSNDSAAQRPWWRRRRVRVRAAVFVLALAMVAAGAFLQLMERDRHAFRWLYFTASLPFLWWLVSAAVRAAYVRIELAYFSELVYAWSSLRFATCLLVASLLALPLYQAFFVWAWCARRACRDPTYAKAAEATWRVLLCLVLFSLAHFIKSLAAKLISAHFYKTAHIAKVKAALEQEYFLLSLSKPRPPMEPPRALGALAANGAAGAAAAVDGLAATVLPALTKISATGSEQRLSPAVGVEQ